MSALVFLLCWVSLLCHQHLWACLRVCADVQHVHMATFVWFMDYEVAAPHVQTSTEIFAQTSNKLWPGEFFTMDSDVLSSCFPLETGQTDVRKNFLQVSPKKIGIKAGYWQKYHIISQNNRKQIRFYSMPCHNLVWMFKQLCLNVFLKKRTCLFLSSWGACKPGTEIHTAKDRWGGHV